jgi:hypothetical protein
MHPSPPAHPPPQSAGIISPRLLHIIIAQMFCLGKSCFLHLRPTLGSGEASEAIGGLSSPGTTKPPPQWAGVKVRFVREVPGRVCIRSPGDVAQYLLDSSTG